MTTERCSFNTTRCDVCLVSFSGPTPAEQHYSSMRHRNKAKIARLAHESDGSNLSTIRQSFGNRVFCKTCNISCDTQQMLDEHELTAKHLAAVEKKCKPTTSIITAEFITIPELGNRDSFNLSTGRNTDAGIGNVVIGKNPITNHQSVVSSSVLKLNTGSLNNSDLLSAGFVNNLKLSHDRNDEDQEYEFTVLGRGRCYACCVDLTSLAMTKEHIKGQRHINAKKHWDINRQCDSRNKRNNEQTATCSAAVREEEDNVSVQPTNLHDTRNTLHVLLNSGCNELLEGGGSKVGDSEINPFSLALGIADLERSDDRASSSDGIIHSKNSEIKHNTRPLVMNDNVRIFSSKKKQNPSDKTTWLMCPVCIKKLNSEKMLIDHLRTHPGRPIPIKLLSSENPDRSMELTLEKLVRSKGLSLEDPVRSMEQSVEVQVVAGVSNQAQALTIACNDFGCRADKEICGQNNTYLSITTADQMQQHFDGKQTKQLLYSRNGKIQLNLNRETST